MSVSPAFARAADFLDGGIVFSTFSADLVEKIGCHKFQQPYFGNHILGCLQDGFQQALAAPFQNCVALVACHLADLRNGQYIRVIC